MEAITLLRKIDLYGGTAGCFILSLIQRIIRFFKPAGKYSVAPRSVVCIDFSEMGAVIVVARAVAYLKKKYPDAQLYFWVLEEHAAVLQLLAYTPDTHIVTVRSANPFVFCWDVVKTLARIRSLHIDTVIDLELFLRYSVVLGYCTGAPRRIGHYAYAMEGLYRGSVLTHPVLYNPYCHISENYRALIDALHEPGTERPLLKRSASSEEYVASPVMCPVETIEHVKKTFLSELPSGAAVVTINPGFYERLPVRSWPYERMQTLVARFMAAKNIAVVLVGKKSVPDAWQKQFTGCLDLVGKLTVAELLAVFSVVDLVITQDCGMVHMAALTPVNIVALYGPETPRVYGPLSARVKIFYKEFMCSPCLTAYNHRNTVCADNKCMQAITVEEVYAHSMQVLSRR